MAKSSFSLNSIPNLGVGVGFRPSFKSALFTHAHPPDFLEVTADHYLVSHPEKREELMLLKHHFTLIPHAINLSLGSADGLDLRYLEKLAQLIEIIQPPYWSEHLAFTRVHGIEIGHLSPLPYKEEAIAVFCRNIEKTREYISIPLILENITYPLQLPGQEMSETDFIRKVVENADVGLLLDITNLYTNSVNHQFSWQNFLQEIPQERVVQLHFTGGHWQDGVLIDSHGHPTPPEVWQIMQAVVEQCEVKGIILERDENIPPYDVLAKELEQAKQILNIRKHTSRSKTSFP